jgi:hypothetical protein
MSTRELYGIIPFQVYEKFIDSFVSKWESICYVSFNEVERILKDVVESLCTKHFGRFKSSCLLYEVMYIRFNSLKTNIQFGHPQYLGQNGRAYQTGTSIVLQKRISPPLHFEQIRVYQGQE